MEIHSRNGLVAINQTRSQEDKVFRDKRCHYTLAMKYGHLRA